MFSQRRRAVSLLIGVNSLGLTYVANKFGNLLTPTSDVERYEIELPSSFEINRFVEPGHTSIKAVCTAIARYSNGDDRLSCGDILLITFSGHGGFYETIDINGNFQRTETWCLYDGQLLDVELVELLSRFEKGVRILLLSDSCNSGGILDFFEARITESQKLFIVNKGFDFPSFERFLLASNGFEFVDLTENDGKLIDNNIAILNQFNASKSGNDRIIFNDLSFFDRESFTNLPVRSAKISTLPSEVLKNEWRINTHAAKQNGVMTVSERLLAAKSALAKKTEENLLNGYNEAIAASVILLTASGANQVAIPNRFNMNGLFTESILNTWKRGNFTGNYSKLHEEVYKLTMKHQTPQYIKMGIPSTKFENEIPFTI